MAYRKCHCFDCGKEQWHNPATTTGGCIYCNGIHVNFTSEIKKSKEAMKELRAVRKDKGIKGAI